MEPAMTVTTGRLVERFGINATDVTRWVHDSVLRPVAGGGGSGNHYEFDDEITPKVVEVMLRLRAATSCGFVALIGRTARAQLADIPDLDIVAVDLGDGVVITISVRGDWPGVE